MEAVAAAFCGAGHHLLAKRRFELIFVKFAMARDLHIGRHERDLSRLVESIQQPVEPGASRNDRSPRKRFDTELAVRADLTTGELASHPE